jgi:septum site-determining protein MinC
MSETSSIQIKGIRDGLLVTLSEAGWIDQRRTLLDYIAENPSFFQGARIVLDVGNQALKVAELSPLRDALSERGITLWAILSSSPMTESTAQILGLATRMSKPRPEEMRPAKGIDDETALWINRTLRSGVRIEFAGHVVVLGDVNAGAEIIAGGSVIVWGRLRGVVHAGVDGNREAVVCALDLAPTQLRVADEIAVSPKRQGKPQPEMVQIKDGRLEALPWSPDPSK